MSGVQRSARISEARATGQYWWYSMPGFCGQGHIVASSNFELEESDVRTSAESGGDIPFASEVAMRRMSLFLTCYAVLVVAKPCAAQSVLPDVINEWSVLASQLAATPPAMHPLRTPVTLAILHLAMYDAVNAVTGAREAYAVSPNVPRPSSAYAAAVAAGHGVLLNEFPRHAEAVDEKRRILDGALPDSAEKSNGAIVGANVAAKLLSMRSQDGRDAILPPFKPGAGAGAYVQTP